MDWFTLVKRHYDAGRYSNAQVAVFTAAGKITPEQHETITDDVYAAPAE